MHITTLEIDVVKNVFQLHGVDARGRVVLSRRVKREQLVHAVASLSPCVIGMEACGSAKHWGRTFEELAHTVKRMHPSTSSRTSRRIRMIVAMRERSVRR